MYLPETVVFPGGQDNCLHDPAFLLTFVLNHDTIKMIG